MRPSVGGVTSAARRSRLRWDGTNHGADYRGDVGVIGELFPGQKLTDEGSEDSDGQTHRPRVEIDLDAGVVRLGPIAPSTTDKPSE